MAEGNIHRIFIYTDSFKSASTFTGSDNAELPLVSTLPNDIQEAISKYVRLPDRQMSLASALLKYYFIHRTAKIPWKEIVISRTPKPHHRPYWDPKTAPSARHNGDEVQLEFNVSHQAGLVGLAGCVLPPGTQPPLLSAPSGDSATPIAAGKSRSTEGPTPQPLSSSGGSQTRIRLGLDITCPNEPGRGPHSNMNNTSQLHDWIDVFAEVFSSADINRMKYSPLDPIPPPGTYEREVLRRKLRRFYTYFALQEAYVKMTGEALLAEWLKDVEYRNVKVPPEADQDGSWVNEIDTGTEVWLRGRRLEEVKTEIRAWGKSFIVATVIDGSGATGSSVRSGEPWKFLDWKEEIEPCALGRCSCLH